MDAQTAGWVFEKTHMEVGKNMNGWSVKDRCVRLSHDMDDTTGE